MKKIGRQLEKTRVRYAEQHLNNGSNCYFGIVFCCKTEENVLYCPYMKKIKVFFAVLACKMARTTIRLLGRGGTDLPGRIALKICPDLLRELAKTVTTVIVTGTNGKTTTSRMIEQAFIDSGISYFANKTGANLISGITAEFAVHSTLSGKCRSPWAVIESDEAAFKQVGKALNPKAVVVTNVFRDQLDRYGEVTHTLGNIRIGLEGCPNAVVCLNADDSLSASLAGDIPNEILFYGVNTPIYKTRVEEVSDAPYCIRCKSEYRYDYVTYGHLGGYRCPKCGYARPVPQVAVEEVLTSDTEHSEVVISMDGKRYDTNVNLPGGYNIYNAVSAMAAGKALGLEAEIVSRSLSQFACGFGRMEKFEINGHSLRMILIKNPAGCNQVLNFLTDATEPFLFAACLNDRSFDGKDVSWIWDVDFEKLAEMGDLLTGVYVSGIRADDMATRFKYAGVPTEKLQVFRSYDALLDACMRQDRPVFVMPTYTAMLDLRAAVSKNYGIKNYWE